MPTDGKFGRWVTEEDEIAHFNTSNECVCGESDLYYRHRFFDIAHCSECDREYVLPESAEGAVHPEMVLSTDQEGLVHYSEDPEAYYLLVASNPSIYEYIELPSTSEEKWMWASDGLYIGYLFCNFETLKAMVIAAGFREQGHGTAFMEEWLDTIDFGELQIMAYDHTKPFFNRFDIPIEYV